MEFYNIPELPPMPQERIDLGDRSGNTWQIKFGEWRPAAVPCELAMQGFDIESNTEYCYRRQLDIPADYAGKRILVRFDGVYSHARCWVNGQFVRSHTGGFTSWDCDLTPFVRAGETVTLTVGVADMEGDPSWASWYAHHNIGGILRDVTLFALPQTYLARLHTQVRFDRAFADAVLSITAQLGGSADASTLLLELQDPQGKTAARGQIDLSGTGTRETALAVTSPLHWDAEHPNLYTLLSTLETDGERQTLRERVGFREIHYGGRDGAAPNKLYVNGKEVKLRGTCRHDVSPWGGRSTTREEDFAEIRAYREANINHIRTSHYPPSRHLLEACDELGMYVEEENGACFQGANGYDVHAAPEDFFVPFTEMVERDRNHPCILIWSLGNESGFERTPAYRMEYEFVKQADPSRPVIFSYPYTVETFPRPYDIISRHYENVDGTLGSPDLPVLHDEFAHISCYNLDELARDPNVRNFWGNGLKAAWEAIFATDGALGADLWGGIDDVFLLPEAVAPRWQRHSPGRATGYGQWGCVLDRRRRQKPEAYLTKKAYSPIRLHEKAACILSRSLIVPVENRFDHTDLSEVELRCRVDGGTPDSPALPAIGPHESGQLVLEGDWDRAHSVELSFYTAGREIDSYRLTLHEDAQPIPVPCAEAPSIEEAGREIVVRAKELCVRFDRREGRLVEASLGGQPLLTGGPHLHVTGAALGEWVNECAVNAVIENGRAVVTLQGHYGALRVQFTVRVGGDGSLTAEYQLRDTALLDAAKLTELGLSFDIPHDVARVAWLRDSLYSVYLARHIGRPSGEAARRCPQPAPEWEQEMSDEFLLSPGDARNGLATNDFKAMREHIRRYEVFFERGGAHILLESGGELAARVQLEDGKTRLAANSQWYYPGLSWGNDAGRPVRLSVGGDRCGIRLRLL